MLEMEEEKVGKTGLSAKLTVLEQLETANWQEREWQKRESCECPTVQNPGSFASRGTVDAFLGTESQKTDQSSVHHKQWSVKEDGHSDNNSCYPKLFFQISIQN